MSEKKKKEKRGKRKEKKSGCIQNHTQRELFVLKYLLSKPKLDLYYCSICSWNETFPYNNFIVNIVNS